MNTRLLMMLHVNVATPQNIGAVPHGTRRTSPIMGGDFEGSRLRGTVLPGGSADWLLRGDTLKIPLRPAASKDGRNLADEPHAPRERHSIRGHGVHA